MIGYLDCSTGVSGDKFLGALLDAGSVRGDFTVEMLQRIVSSIAPEAIVVVEHRRSHGIAAVGVSVETTVQPHSRTWAAIRDLLDGADLSERVHRSAVATFEHLAIAEAHAHGTDVDRVHFHEVGALDSIMDIVGVNAGLDALGIDLLMASPVATGSGTVTGSHGVLPVPAPATAALLLGIPTVPGPEGPSGAPIGELTTPTGAALLAANVAGYGVCPPLVSTLVGYGAGTRDIGVPNVCRLIVGDPEVPEIRLRTEETTLLETNIDHLSAEAAAFAAEQLMAEGALDVWTTPIVMKKGRAAFTMSVLVACELANGFAERLVALTGTLGVRRTDLGRLTAEREIRILETDYGPVRVKVGPDGADPRWRIEHEDVARIARETGRSYGEVHRELHDGLDIRLGE